MRKQRLGCFTPMGFVAAIITILAIAAAGFAQGGALFSPGDLNAVTGSILGGVISHAELSSTCNACHAAPWESTRMADRCLSCHPKVQADLSNPKTIHGGMIHTPEDANCLNCHTEHHGAQAFLTRLDITNFPHQVTGFALNGHPKRANGSPFECQNCHGQNYAKLNDQNCVACHNWDNRAFMRQHTSAFGKSCMTCHDGLDTYGKAFDHNKTTFLLVGKHAQANCSSCHQKQTTIAALRETRTDCASCHQKEDAHKGILGANCAACHTPAAWKPANFNHTTQTRYPLTGKHLVTRCTGCHTNPDLKMTPQDCTACHSKNDPHQGKLGAACSDCHTTTGWKPSTFDHTKASYQLTGKHQQAPCSGCHKDQAYKGLPQDCAACHSTADVHKAALGSNCAGCHTTAGWKPSTFNHNNAAFKLTGKHLMATCSACHQDTKFKGAPQVCSACHSKEDAHKGGLGTECVLCHSTNAWKPSTFNHARTAFPLTGAHARAECTTCHANHLFKGTPANCGSCHQRDDTHKGAMGSDCKLCHSTNAWKPSTFNHASAAFQLTGAHARASCSGCHQNNVYKGTPTTCASCHQKDDAHRGSMGTTCSGCHTTNAWKPSTFNHANAAFKLTGAHTNVACSSCHQNGVFKGTPSSCASCHQKDDAHQGGLGTNCAACHSANAWKPSTFNHANAAFQLTGAHTTVACSACHTNGVFKGTPTSCASCHQKDDAHQGSLGSSCATCHSTSAWKPSTFNHANTAFPLTGAHIKVPCATCHTNGYKGTPTACNSCHAEPAYHSGLFLANCAACHSTSAWIPAKYSGSHTFPINHGGANTCRKCHPSTLNTYTCYTCHDKTEMVNKHKERNVSNLDNCVACHPTGKGD